ncbi:glycosyltransferase family 4 protein [Chloroflexus aggregans]|uniref:Glycosyl transferase, group 1 n=1 Tax=Chloroflexus aggregans (strain MD-66 / DSM 9485) TaxID=326427 RepID=B8G5B5_CHLAD|nr:glycosyltransferase [Chloroflexus aggregans]ACL25621.1 glycosyl transferase, group 1 [Chloroflexus aggregans DSM 9485]
MSTLLIIAHDVIGRRMAGPGIRMWELARVLAHTLPVTLIAPRPIDLPPTAGVTYGHYRWGEAASLAPYLATASIALINGFVAAAHPEVLTYAGRLIIDLYDPVAFENLELFRRHPMTERRHIAERDVALLRDLLRRGDHFLCATERQRDLYIGGLLALGRLTPDLIDTDPLLRRLIDVVPFGVSDDPPQASGQPALRGVLDDLGPDHEIILWSSGLWDWLDPQTVVRAMPHVLTVVPNARLVFLAGRHPGLGYEMITPQQTRQLAAELGLLGKGVHFYEEWIPYERRADFLLEATVMVSLHCEHLETCYAAVRSRVLDHLWVGKPTVLSAGDAAADLIVSHDAGEAVPIGDVDAVAAALIRLLADPQRQAVQSVNAAKLGQQLRWSHVMQPLICMLTVPLPVSPKAAQSQSDHEIALVDADLPSQEETISMVTPDIDQTAAILHKVRNDAIRAQEQIWKMEQPASGGLSWRWLQQKIWVLIMKLQRDYNAAVLRSTYALAEQIDHTTRLLFDVSARLEQRAQTLEQRAQTLEQRAQTLEQRAQTLEQRAQTLEQRAQTFEQLVQELRLRVANLEDGMQDHNHRQVAEIHQIGQQIRDFADQLAGLEETTAQVLAHLGGVPTLPPQQE